MKRTTGVKLVFSALVLGALGFGAGQAVAGPAGEAATERCTWEMHQICDENCTRDGYRGGMCRVPAHLGVTVCECF